MNIVVNIGVGGDRCGAGVRHADYDAFDSVGAEMELSRIVIYALYYDDCKHMLNQTDI